MQLAGSRALRICYVARVKDVDIPPLTEAETQELRQLLETAQGASLEFAHGVFAALATAPTPKDVTDWLPMVVGDKLPEKAQLKRAFSLLMRDLKACEQCLRLGVPSVPAPEDEAAVAQFCKGYMRIAHADARWKSDMEAFALTVPFAVLGGYLAPESLRALSPELASDPSAWCDKQRKSLADTTARLHAYFAPLREGASQSAAPQGKVGRNEPCPCQSGKKYKKCCGMS